MKRRGLNPVTADPMRGGKGEKTLQIPFGSQEGLFSVRELGRIWLRDLHRVEKGELQRPYFGGAGTNPSRLRPGSGLGFGFGAFLASFLPLSLLPMGASVTQEGRGRKELNAATGCLVWEPGQGNSRKAPL